MDTWIVQAFKKKRYLPDGSFGIDDCATVTVAAYDEKTALEKVKRIIKRKYYRVAQVFERTEEQKFQQEMAMANLEIQMKILKKLR